MSDKEYMAADCEVISMVNRGRGEGGKLPGKAIHFIPEETAPMVLAIDQRIQQIHQHRGIILAAVMLLCFLIGTAL